MRRLLDLVVRTVFGLRIVIGCLFAALFVEGADFVSVLSLVLLLRHVHEEKVVDVVVAVHPA